MESLKVKESVSDLDGLYNPQLERLIDLALADGELTEKEKQVLFKKAQVMGVDLDEFEMVLQAKLFERQKALKKDVSPSAASAAPKSNKFGDIRKCPQCGAVVDAYTAICAECGYAFNNVTNESEIKILAARIEALEQERQEPVEFTEKKKIGCLGIAGWVLFFWILIPLKIGKALTGIISKVNDPKLWTSTDKKMEGVIMNYAVPNTKAELIEFAILCQSRIKPVRYFEWLKDEGGYNLKWNSVWQSKLAQINTKAQVALKSDPVGLQTIKDLYNQASKSMKEDRKSMLIIFGAMVALIVAVILWLFL